MNNRKVKNFYFAREFFSQEVVDKILQFDNVLDKHHPEYSELSNEKLRELIQLLAGLLALRVSTDCPRTERAMFSFLHACYRGVQVEYDTTETELEPIIPEGTTIQ